jgi:hypothetical protein
VVRNDIEAVLEYEDHPVHRLLKPVIFRRALHTRKLEPTRFELWASKLASDVDVRAYSFTGGFGG